MLMFIGVFLAFLYHLLILMVFVYSKKIVDNDNCLMYG